MIVDFFPFFAPYGEETLKLRYEVLKDQVDYFVIAESNKTHSGYDVERQFLSLVKKLDLDPKKIIYIPHEIPGDDELEVQAIDVQNTYGNRDKIESQRARARERLQKDALLDVLEEFTDDTVFIHGDSDEIVKPEAVQYLAKVCRENQNIIIKVPLVYLEGRGDLRLHHRENGAPVQWSGGMFLATKAQLKKATPSQIRSNVNNPFPIHYVTENGKAIQDLGWHFSWMGGAEKRALKSQVWAHYNDSFEWLGGNETDSVKEIKSYRDEAYVKFLTENQLQEGSTPPSGNKNHVLKKYSVSELPKEILKSDYLRNFFLPAIKEQILDVSEKAVLDPSSVINNYKKRIWIVDDFYRNPDEVRQYAMTREFDEGGIGRGYIGRRTFKQYLFNGMKEEFEKIMGKKITRWEQYGMNGRFQYCYAGEPLVYHCDEQKYAGMLFLTPNAPFQTGTSMFAHKATRIRHNSHPEIMSTFSGHTTLDRTPYEPVDVVGNVYNRLVIFDAGLIHAASEYFGYNLENSRLWQMFFFDAE